MDGKDLRCWEGQGWWGLVQQPTQELALLFPRSLNPMSWFSRAGPIAVPFTPDTPEASFQCWTPPSRGVECWAQEPLQRLVISLGCKWDSWALSLLLPLSSPLLTNPWPHEHQHLGN